MKRGATTPLFLLVDVPFIPNHNIILAQLLDESIQALAISTRQLIQLELYHIIRIGIISTEV